MPGTTLRVHQLAKELGVPSKAIIQKCADEGIELKNHMAAISLGLAESIREWFSVGADVTSVEVGRRVEVDKVRKPRPKKAASTPTDTEAPAQEQPTATTAVAPPPAEPETTTRKPPAEAEAEAAPTAESAAPVEAPAPAEAEPAPDATSEPTTADEPVAPAATTAAPETPPVETPPEEPDQPPAEAEDTEEAAAASTGESDQADEAVAEAETDESVGPAGPQVVPKPAELQGPRVVRVEAPEPVRPQRPRAPAARGPMERGTPAPPPADTSSRRGRKSRSRGEEEVARGRSRSPRRHGGGPSDVDARVREWRDQDLIERKERLASVTGHGLRDRRAAERRRRATQGGSSQAQRKEPVSVTTPVQLKEFCAATGAPFAQVSKKLMEHTGQFWTINQSIEADMVELLSLELEIPVTVQQAKTAYQELEESVKKRERKNLQSRPPVVAMLGHVDHGKTSLLDAIRHANVAKGEAGGITQHIGAYRIKQGEWDVSFVDTPGHQAFTAMRARGAHLTDVVVLVVAADDGVMPQTIEAINHAKAAGVAIVVALNKIDIPGVDLNRVYAQLSEQGLTPADWGGETDVIKTSATSGEGIDDLIAHLSTLSELLELKADPNVPAVAAVIEAQMREGKGVVAQVLVREGTLKPGQTFICGPASGRIRTLIDDRGKNIREAGPGSPVEVVGLNDLPRSGDSLFVVKNLGQAKTIAEEVQTQRRQEELESTTTSKPRTLEALVNEADAADVPELRVIMRADVQGSVEVLRKSLEGFPADKARLNVLQAAVGAITEADVHLAKASDALVIGFHVVAEERARQLADQLGVEIRLYRVIYEIMDDVEKALAGLLEPEQQEEVRGAVEVRQVFNVSRVGTIAGCYVTDGIVSRNHKARLIRDGRVVVERADIDSLKRFKDDAREVRAGLECGIKLAGYDDIKPGDVIQAYEIVEVAQQL